ncbi:MAG: FG-GAP repeat protein [Bacteroidota bacterium]
MKRTSKTEHDLKTFINKPKPLFLPGETMPIACRKTRSLYQWLCRVAGVEACWIEGIKKEGILIWSVVKKIAGNWFMISINNNNIRPGHFLRRCSILVPLLLTLSRPAEVLAQADIDISSLLTGSPQGVVFNGVADFDRTGTSTAVGDVNGDGIEDVIIGARLADPGGIRNAGIIYVVFGSSEGFASELELSSLDGTNGFAIHGIENRNRSGRSVAAGDINGDGKDDVIIGSQYAYDSFGGTYVVFGNNTIPPVVELSSLDGNNGFVIKGARSNDRSGRSVAAGDINGDGADDVIIGAHYADPNRVDRAGQTFVVFGNNQQDDFDAKIELDELNRATGFVINGINRDDKSGYSVSAGDIDGDGTDDVIIGAPYARANRKDEAGASYVVFGKNQGNFDSEIELDDLNGSTGFVLTGVNSYEYSGKSVTAGDINGDEKDDVVIRAPGYKLASSPEATYVVFGRDRKDFDDKVRLSDLDGRDGFVVNGSIDDTEERTGSRIAMGDVNRDQIDDLIIGSYLTHSNGFGFVGITYVVFGSDQNNYFRSGVIELADLDGNNGIVLNGVNSYDFCGSSVLTGDIDGDGIQDLIIGASGGDPNGQRSGEVYVLFNLPVTGSR